MNFIYKVKRFGKAALAVGVLGIALYKGLKAFFETLESELPDESKTDTSSNG